MLMEGGPRVVYSWELKLSTNITKSWLWTTSHIRPRGWADETRIEPCSNADAQDVLDTIHQLHIHTRLRRKRERCVKARRAATHPGRTPREASFDWQVSCKEKNVFQGRVSLCGSGWSGTHCVYQADLTDRVPPDCASWVLGSKKCSSTPGSIILVKAKLSHEHCSYYQSHVIKLM